MVGLLLGFLGPHRAAFVAKMRQRRKSVPHPEGRSAAEDGKDRLCWNAVTRKSGRPVAARDADARLAPYRRPVPVWLLFPQEEAGQGRPTPIGLG